MKQSKKILSEYKQHKDKPTPCRLNPRSQQAAFTLIEVMVVMLIIAIIIAVAVIALGDMGRGRKAKYIAQEIETAVQNAQQTAILQPTTIVLSLKHNQFSFRDLHMTAKADGSLQYHWQTLTTLNQTLEQLPEYIYARFRHQEKNIVINSSGAISPFQLNIGVNGESTYYQLRSSGSGHIELIKKSGDNG